MSENTLPAARVTISQDAYLKTIPKTGEEHIVKTVAAERTLRDPLPGPMLEAASTEPILVKTSQGEVEVRRLVAYDITLFKKFNSPFYRQMLDPQDETSYTDEESYEMVFQFINPALKVKRAADKGHEFYTNIATEEVGIKFSLDELKPIVEAISKQILSAFATLIGHGVEEKGDFEELVNKYAKNEEEAQQALADKKK